MARHADQVGRSLAVWLSWNWTIRLETGWGMRGEMMEGCGSVARRSVGDMDRIDAWKVGEGGI